MADVMSPGSNDGAFPEFPFSNLNAAPFCATDEIGLVNAAETDAAAAAAAADTADPFGTEFTSVLVASWPSVGSVGWSVFLEPSGSPSTPLPVRI